MSAVLKLKALEGHLQGLTGFAEPKIELEQYETPAHIAAVALYTMQVHSVPTIQRKKLICALCFLSRF